MRNLGREVELLEKIGKRCDIGGSLVERRLDDVRVLRHLVL